MEKLDTYTLGAPVPKALLEEEERNNHRDHAGTTGDRLFTSHAAAGSVSAKRAAAAATPEPIP